MGHALWDDTIIRYSFRLSLDNDVAEVRKTIMRCWNCRHILDSSFTTSCPKCHRPQCTGRDPHIPASDLDSGHDAAKDRGDIEHLEKLDEATPSEDRK